MKVVLQNLTKKFPNRNKRIKEDVIAVKVVTKKKIVTISTSMINAISTILSVIIVMKNTINPKAKKKKNVVAI